MNTVQSDIYSLIRKFVERQKLALSIIEDLHPDFLLRDDLLKDGLIDELLDATKTYSHVPQKGYWGENNEWEYFFHGGGCRLIHSMTREPIDWDPPEILRFDKYM